MRYTCFRNLDTSEAWAICAKSVPNGNVRVKSQVCGQGPDIKSTDQKTDNASCRMHVCLILILEFEAITTLNYLFCCCHKGQFKIFLISNSFFRVMAISHGSQVLVPRLYTLLHPVQHQIIRVYSCLLPSSSVLASDVIMSCIHSRFSAMVRSGVTQLLHRLFSGKAFDQVSIN